MYSADGRQFEMFAESTDLTLSDILDESFDQLSRPVTPETWEEGKSYAPLTTVAKRDRQKCATELVKGMIPFTITDIPEQAVSPIETSMLPPSLLRDFSDDQTSSDGSTEPETDISEDGESEDGIKEGGKDEDRFQLPERVKQGLREKIQTRRESEGMAPLKVEFQEPVEYPLSQEELEKKHARKHRNRLSANKSRERRKEHEARLEQQLDGLEEARDSLTREVAALTNCKKLLKLYYVTHLKTCPARRTVKRPEVNPTMTPEQKIAAYEDYLKS